MNEADAVGFNDAAARASDCFPIDVLVGPDGAGVDVGQGGASTGDPSSGQIRSILGLAGHLC